MSTPRPLRIMAALVALVALVAACREDPGSAELTTDDPAPSPTLQPEDRVDLTVYFRDGGGGHLLPVVREVPVGDDLPRRSVELLLAGPGEEEADHLAAPLPTSTQVLGFEVDAGTALVDLSAHVIRDAEQVGASAENEALALAALAGTLTEFPAIDQVQLTVEGGNTGWRGGVDVGSFWGGWGLPEVLVRDESVLGPPAGDGEGVPDLDLFDDEPQTVGGDIGDPAAISTVRMRNRTTYLRLSIELTDPDHPDAGGAVPEARARAADGSIVVEIDDVTAYTAEVKAGQRQAVDDPAFESLAVEVTELPGTVRLVVSLTEPRPFALRRLSSPTRIVLDVKK